MLNLAQMQHGASLKNLKSDAGDDTLLANQTQGTVVVVGSSLVSSCIVSLCVMMKMVRAILMVINRNPMVINTLRNPWSAPIHELVCVELPPNV